VSLIGGLVLLGGCSTIGQIVEREDAARTEASLAAVGFEILPADTADRVAELDEMPHFKLVTRREGGKVIYAYADPVKCHCEYVGNEEQHAEYDRQRSEQRLAYERNEAQHLEEQMTLDTDTRAPGPALW